MGGGRLSAKYRAGIVKVKNGTGRGFGVLRACFFTVYWQSSMPHRQPPSVSILLPAFNAESTIDVCLRSIQRQTTDNWECIILDDGSDDTTLEQIQRVAGSDSRFRTTSLRHQGLVATLNAGLSLCRGRYIARMDADDVMHRLRLAEQTALLDTERGLAAIGCHVRLFPRDSLQTGTRNYERWLNSIDSPRRIHEEAFVECPVAHPALMIRREVLMAFGYNSRGWPEDYDLILRLLAAGMEIGVLTRKRLSWRQTPGRLSRTAAEYSHSSFTACKAAFLATGFLAASDQYILWGHGGTGRAMRQALLRNHKRPSHIIEVHPGRLGNTIAGAPVVGPEALSGLPRRPLLVSVAGASARSEIRETLRQAGFMELRDFICVA